MNEYERHIFNGICPFTNEPCNKDIDCSECVINHEEQMNGEQNEVTTEP